MDIDQEAIYLNYYQQRGGASPLYNGTRYIQYGNGFGDVLRSTSRHIRAVARKEATPTTDECDTSVEEHTLPQEPDEGDTSVEEPTTPKETDESDTSVEEPTTTKDDAKGSKRKNDVINKTIIYKAPKRKRKHKKPSQKNGSKFRKFNF